MGNKLYVGNLPYSVRDDDLQQAFSEFGSVSSAKVMMERDTGRSKGFGFVEMGSDAEAQAAINGMNGQSLGGRSVTVNEARPMEARPPRTGGFGGDLIISGGAGGAAGIARHHFRHTLHMLEDALLAPETAARQHRDFTGGAVGGIVGGRGNRLVQISCKGGGGDGEREQQGERVLHGGPHEHSAMAA